MNGGITPSGYYSRYNSVADTISVSEGGNSCGYVQYNTECFWSGGHCYTLIDVNQSISKCYLYHYLKYKEKEIMALRIGSGLPNIQKKDLSKFPILILPLSEQQRIANLLQLITEKIKVEKDGYCNLSGLENMATKLWQESGDAALVAAFTQQFIADTLIAMTNELYVYINICESR